MSSILKKLRLVSEPTRIRILHLLRQQELSVVEMQEILQMGQSRISTHLSQLKKEGFVSDERAGKNVIYGAVTSGAEEEKQLWDMIETVSESLSETAADEVALEHVVLRRKDRVRAYFDELAGKFGRSYCPGRSWKSLAEALLKLMPPLLIADLGAGEGTFSQLLAQSAKHVIAVDNSEKMVAYGASVAKENGFQNLEYRLGDIEAPPIDSESVDLAFFSQALHHADDPAVAVEKAFEIVKPGGRVAILDLAKHQFDEARELYADVWLGFSEYELTEFLENAGFRSVEIARVDREVDAPHFQTLLAIGHKPS